MKTRCLYLTAGFSYLIIFFSAIFANFFVLEGLIQNPVSMTQDHSLLVRLGIVAFLVAALFDIVVAWALKELYKTHILTSLSTYLRITHAVIFGASVFALVATLSAPTANDIMNLISTFNNMWLIGLFFFGGHLILLPRIIKLPKLISIMLPLAGALYMIDTVAHFVMPNYQAYASIFLALVATTSILGEMAFSIWLFFQKGRD